MNEFYRILFGGLCATFGAWLLEKHMSIFWLVGLVYVVGIYIGKWVVLLFGDEWQRGV